MEDTQEIMCNTSAEIERYNSFLIRLKSDAVRAKQSLDKYERDEVAAESLLKDITEIQQVYRSRRQPNLGFQILNLNLT